MNRVLLGVGGMWLSVSCLAAAQLPLAAQDANEIEELASSYARALAACDASGFADLFMWESGYFSSGIRGQIVGREGLIGLVESERHCDLPDTQKTQRQKGDNVPVVQIVEATAEGVRGIVDLGSRVGRYEDEYIKAAAGWRFASRTVVTSAELAAGLSASDLAAINALGAPSPGSHYVERDGAERLLSAGVAVSVVDGKVMGRAYQADGSFFDDVYEKASTGEWRIQSRTRATVEEAASCNDCARRLQSTRQ